MMTDAPPRTQYKLTFTLNTESHLTIGGILLVFAIASLGMAKPNLIGNLVVTDVALLGVIGIWIAHVVVRHSRSAPEFNAVLFPLTLIFSGSMFAALHVGITGYVVGDLVRDAAAFCSFFAVVDVLRADRQRLIPYAIWALTFAVSILTLWLVFFDSTLRGKATFPNPNVPGHFMACATVLFASLPMPRARRIVVLGISLIGLYRTGSFGASLQIAAALAYGISTKVIAATRQKERQRTLFFTSAAVIGVGAAFAISSYLGSSAASDESGLSARRLDRSSGTRFAVWGEAWQNWLSHPMGTGPGSSRALQLLQHATEPHSEPLAYLAERGPIALLGLALLWLTFWRRSLPGGAARRLLCGYVLASFFRETLHYRHWWVLLAIAFVIDDRPRLRVLGPDGVLA